MKNMSEESEEMKQLQETMKRDLKEVEEKIEEIERAREETEEAKKEVKKRKEAVMMKINIVIEALRDRIKERERQLKEKCEEVATLKGVFIFILSFHFHDSTTTTTTEKKLEEHSEELKTHQRRFEIERNAMKTVNESKTKELVCARAPKLHERMRRLTEMKVNTKKPCKIWIELLESSCQFV